MKKLLNLILIATAFLGLSVVPAFASTTFTASTIDVPSDWTNFYLDSNIDLSSGATIGMVRTDDSSNDLFAIGGDWACSPSGGLFHCTSDNMHSTDGIIQGATTTAKIIVSNDNSYPFSGAIDYISQNLNFPAMTNISSPTPTPTTSGGGAIVIDPTQQAKINAAVGSIPTTAASEIFAVLPAGLPYLLLFVALSVAFFVVNWLMHKGKHDGL